MNQETVPPEHQPGVPYHSELMEDSRELAQCYLCKQYADVTEMEERQIDAPHHWKLICPGCVEQMEQHA